jgi:hypothetical protein
MRMAEFVVIRQINGEKYHKSIAPTNAEVSDSPEGGLGE